MMIIQFTAEQHAEALFLLYFLYRKDFREHFHQLMEQMAAER